MNHGEDELLNQELVQCYQETREHALQLKPHTLNAVEGVDG